MAGRQAVCPTNATQGGDMMFSRGAQVDELERAQTTSPSVETVEWGYEEEDIYLSPESFIGSEVMHLASLR